MSSHRGPVRASLAAGISGPCRRQRRSRGRHRADPAAAHVTHTPSPADCGPGRVGAGQMERLLEADQARILAALGGDADAEHSHAA